eukprot:GCRY01000975.1.p1 GENE.GCRY01000975.1~~GCRY01000975.1.p1  ORF type:complete len:162 (+),score=6.71 GCRY01000975.1:70-486(+)
MLANCSKFLGTAVQTRASSALFRSISVKVKDETGRIHKVEGKPGDTLLKACMKNGLDLKSVCRGNQICGRCHVLIEEKAQKIIPYDDELHAPLSYIAKFEPAVAPASRLACAIKMQDNWEGLTFEHKPLDKSGKYKGL